jgi:hypothetical protein
MLLTYNKSSTFLRFVDAHGSSQLHSRVEFEHGLGAAWVAHGRFVTNSTQRWAIRKYFCAYQTLNVLISSYRLSIYFPALSLTLETPEVVARRRAYRRRVRRPQAVKATVGPRLRGPNTRLRAVPRKRCWGP